MSNKNYFVRDYMHKTISLNGKGATFHDALTAMVKHKRNGIFIVDDQDQVVGIVSAWDIIQHVVPDYLEDDLHLAPFESGTVLLDRAKVVANDSIDLFMTKKVHTVHEDSTVMEAATTLSEFRIRQLPVVDNDGRLKGCINRTDVKLVIAEILEIEDLA